jgi:hypothetical protein
MAYNPDKYISKLGAELKWVYIDLDGTLAEAVWQHSKGIGAPIEENIPKLIALHEKGKKLFIYTARPWHDYEGIERWLEDHDLRQYIKGIICGKPIGHAYVDDRAVLADADTWTII